jgi:hypothetical protein
MSVEICFANESPARNWELARIKVIDQEWTAFKKSKGIDLSDKIDHYSADFKLVDRPKSQFSCAQICRRTEMIWE